MLEFWLLGAGILLFQRFDTQSGTQHPARALHSAAALPPPCRPPKQPSAAQHTAAALQLSQRPALFRCPASLLGGARSAWWDLQHWRRRSTAPAAQHSARHRPKCKFLPARSKEGQQEFWADCAGILAPGRRNSHSQGVCELAPSSSGALQGGKFLLPQFRCGAL